MREVDLCVGWHKSLMSKRGRHIMLCLRVDRGLLPCHISDINTACYSVPGPLGDTGALCQGNLCIYSHPS